jgi:hypothetical protein
MSYKPDLVVDKAKASAIKKELSRIPRLAMYSGRQTMRVMSNRFAADIRARYIGGSGEHDPLTEATQEKRRFGKMAGNYPMIPPYPGSTPLKRSGMLAKLVDIRRKEGKQSTSYAVGLRPGVPLPHSPDSMSNLVGMVHEFGETHMLTITPRMRRYLFALLELAGRANEKAEKGPAWGSKRLGSFGGALQVLIHVPARPVWIPAIGMMMHRQPKEFARIFFRQLQKRTKFKLVKHGP